MKKKLAFAAFMILLCCIAAAPSAFAAVADKGVVYYTDIVATINGEPVPYISVSVNGNAGVGTVAVTDLTNYGFDVSVNNSSKTATITFNANKAITPLPVVEATGKPGNVAYRYYSTDWKVNIAGKTVDCYNVASRLSIKFGDLEAFGKFSWNGGTRVSAFRTNTAPNPNPNPSPTSYSVSGKVADQATGAAVSGATVSLYINGSSAAPARVISDANGNFTFASVSAGSNCYIEVTYPTAGYGTARSSGFTVNSNVTGIAVSLQKTANATVSGVVYDNATNAVIRSASVTLKTSAGAAAGAATTDANGAYSIAGVAAGGYSLSVAASGYTTSTVSVTVSGTALRQDVRLSRTGYTISGSVSLGYSSSSVSLNGIQVTLYINSVSSSNIVGTVYTGTNGTFQFTGLSNGVYYAVVSASPYGYYSESRSGQISVNGRDATATVTLSASSAALTGRVTVPSGVYLDSSYVTVTAYDSSGSQISGSVTVQIPYRNNGNQVTTDQFSVPLNSFSGSRNVYLRVSYSYSLTGSGSYQAGTAQSSTVSVSGSQTYSTDVGYITLNQSGYGYTVSGYVSGILSGKTATVYIDNYSTGQRYQTSVLSDGSYTITGVPNGDYIACAFLNDNPSINDTKQIYIYNGNSSGNNFVIPSAATVTITGRVTDAVGNPLPNVAVYLTGNSSVPSVLTNATGYYSISGVPAVSTGFTYVLTFIYSGQQRTIQVPVFNTNVSGADVTW